MLKSKGNTREEKAQNFWIKDEAEEKALSHQTTKMQDCYNHVKYKKPLCTAMAFLHRFFLNESIFIYDIEQIAYAAMYLAQKLDDNYIT